MRLAELVVLQPAVGVVDAAAPAVGDALLELEHGGVVLALAQRGLAHQDVAELRERPQQLRGAESSRWSTLKPWPAGRPKNGFGTCSSSAAPSDEVLDGHLVDVDDAVVRAAETEVAAGGADVLEADRDVAGQLARDVDRVLVDLRRLLVLVDELDVRCRRRSARRACCRSASARRSGTGCSASRSG